MFRNRFRPFFLISICGLFVFSTLMQAHAADPAAKESPVAFQLQEGLLRISIGDQPIADYVWNDELVTRPYFRHLRTRSGIQVTRTHPPVKGQDIDDHPTMHPGLWLAFGDLNGTDFWRNKGRVRHVEFSQAPQGGVDRGTFTVKNSYERDGQVLAAEVCRITISVRPAGYVLNWQSTFRSDQSALTFGDQEEMGLGVRVATPLAVVKGGQILDSEHRRNGAEVWGKQADWCEYTGVLEGQRVGIVLMPGSHNFRRAWFHARDYGLLVANPFGQKAFTKGELSQVVTSQGKDFPLEFNVLVYNTKGDQPLDVAAEYRALTNKSSTKP